MAKQETKQESRESRDGQSRESQSRGESRGEHRGESRAKPDSKPKQATPRPAKPKIRIHLKGYDQRVLDASARDIVETAKRTGAGVAGPIPLPTTIQKYTVLVSPHVDKKSREQFETREHKRLLIIENPTARTVENLKGLNVPAGVDIKIKA